MVAAHWTARVLETTLAEMFPELEGSLNYRAGYWETERRAVYFVLIF